MQAWLSSRHTCGEQLLCGVSAPEWHHQTQKLASLDGRAACQHTKLAVVDNASEYSEAQDRRSFPKMTTSRLHPLAKAKTWSQVPTTALEIALKVEHCCDRSWNLPEWNCNKKAEPKAYTLINCD